MASTAARLLALLALLALLREASAWRTHARLPAAGLRQSRAARLAADSPATPASPTASAPVAPAITSSSGLKGQLMADMKDAMKAKDKARLSAIRSVQSAIKQKEVDERVAMTDEAILQILTKLVKQRKESIKSFVDGGREDLVASEQAECDVISSYLPAQMSGAEISAAVGAAITRLGAVTIKDMGRVMADLRSSLNGKADLTAVGDLVRKQLAGK